jgi:hypothetical protein
MATEAPAAERETCRSCRWLDQVPERSAGDGVMTVLAHAICRGGPPDSKGWPIIEFPDEDYCRMHEPELALDAVKR